MIQKFHYYLIIKKIICLYIQCSLLSYCIVVLICYVGELLGEVRRFDHELIQNLLDAYRKPKVSTITEFSPLLLTAVKKEELDRLLAGVQSGKETFHLFILCGIVIIIILSRAHGMGIFM